MPASNRNAGRNEIGMGGRLQFGMHRRLRRNLHDTAETHAARARRRRRSPTGPTPYARSPAANAPGDQRTQSRGSTAAAAIPDPHPTLDRSCSWELENQIRSLPASKIPLLGQTPSPHFSPALPAFAETRAGGRWLGRWRCGRACSRRLERRGVGRCGSNVIKGTGLLTGGRRRRGCAGQRHNRVCASANASA